MPLFESGPQLNSTCSLKSSNFRSLMSSGPLPGVVSKPFSTFHDFDASVEDWCQPVKSLPLKSAIPDSHAGAAERFSDGARRPVQFQVLPSGPFTVPERVLPSSFPSNVRSSFAPSSSFGETNFTCPFEDSAEGSGRAFPQRPTNSALSCPFSARSSSQDGYS